MNESEQWNYYFTGAILFLTLYTIIKDALNNVLIDTVLAFIFTAILINFISKCLIKR